MPGCVGFLHTQSKPLEVSMNKIAMAWQRFEGTKWKTEIDVRQFILDNVTPYLGDESFLTPSSNRIAKLWEKAQTYLKVEHARGGVYAIDTSRVSSPPSFAPGYIDQSLEYIVGLQTDEPLKRGVNPFGGIRMARQACEAYGYTLSDTVESQFSYKTTHNEGVFRVYSDTMKQLRSEGILTGLPDAYGRGRIIGDYRRVALYGLTFLIEHKMKEKDYYMSLSMDESTIRLIEELHKQIDFLNKLGEMARTYGDDVYAPAKDSREAIQWTYYAYLASLKEQNGAAMSLGRVGTFLDIYITRDLDANKLTESEAQALMDDFVIKLRLARQLRTPDYNALFAGDPLWITESLGGMAEDGRTLVTKNTYRFIHSLTNLGPAPEPNLTILWSKDLPSAFKQYCAKMSIETDALQYENDDLMRPIYGDDYGIACCVSAMRIGKEMQFFGARCNLPKALLLALSGGEASGLEIPGIKTVEKGHLNYEDVIHRLDKTLKWLCGEYVNTMNIIHYMHDKYAYEKTQMALHDANVHRYMAFGIAGLSVVADSLSAIKYAQVEPIFNESGHLESFITTGDFPMYGNDDDRVDQIAVWLTERFMTHLKAHKTYRDAEHTLSILTITSNVVYGKKTKATPDGRKSGEPFAPGANPMHHREKLGALAALNSVSKLPYASCKDGISCTFSIMPNSLGRDLDAQKKTLVSVLEGYFSSKGHHLNVNVIDPKHLLKAMNHPERYSNLTIRVSGYAVNFCKLEKAHQLEVLQRTYHNQM